MRKVLICLTIVVIMSLNSYYISTAITNLNKTVINVKNYGAKGDGVTDDSNSIQNAINYASANNATLIIPASSNYYKVNNTLTLKSNLHISGYGATLFMQSQTSVKNIFMSSSTTFIDNVSIEGLSLKSANDRAGTEYQINSLTSNVQGMYIQGISNFRMKNVRMDNMYDGLKLGAASNGVLNYNINIDNLQIYNSRTPLLMLATKDFVMSNSVLDANGGKTYYLHAAYIGGDTNNVLFNNVKFMNSPGGGIHIYNGHTTKKAAQGIVVENSTFENVRVGAYVYSGASNITFSNNKVTNTGLAYKILNASNVNINNVEISQQKYNDGSNGAFYIAYASTSQITDVTVDGTGMTGNLFDFGENVSDLTVSRLQVKNFPDNGVFNTPVKTVKNLSVEDSSFEWSKVTAPRISFTGSGSSASFKNNVFENLGAETNALVYNTSGTDILLEGNYYYGFKSIATLNEYSRLLNNEAGISNITPLTSEAMSTQTVVFLVDDTSYDIKENFLGFEIIVPTESITLALSEAKDYIIKSRLFSDFVIEINVLTKNNPSLPVEIKIPIEGYYQLENEGIPLIVKSNGVSFYIEPGFTKLSGDEVSITITNREVEQDIIDSAFEPISSIYDLDILVNKLPVNTFITKPVITLELPLGTTEPEKKCAYIKNDDNSWDYLMTYYDAKTNSVQFKAPHFGNFALIGYTKTFDDIQNHWAKTNIEEMASKHITTGISESLFAPNRKISRVEFTIMTLKAIDEYTPGIGTFFDVEPNQWYFEYVARAKDIGIITADSNGNYNPNDNITRQEMAVVIAKAHAYLNEMNIENKTEIVTFKDANQIDSNSLKYVRYLQEKGIVLGFNNYFLPRNEASRAEALSIIRQMITN